MQLYRQLYSCHAQRRDFSLFTLENEIPIRVKTVLPVFSLVVYGSRTVKLSVVCIIREAYF